MGMSVANTTGRLATPTTTSNIFAAAGGGPSSIKTVGGDNNIGSDANQVQNYKNTIDYCTNTSIKIVYCNLKTKNMNSFSDCTTIRCCYKC